MPTYKPVDFDPFAPASPSGNVRLKPVDFDPFADPKKKKKEEEPFYSGVIPRFTGGIGTVLSEVGLLAEQYATILARLNNAGAPGIAMAGALSRDLGKKIKTESDAYLPEASKQNIIEQQEFIRAATAKPDIYAKALSAFSRGAATNPTVGLLAQEFLPQTPVEAARTIATVKAPLRTGRGAAEFVASQLAPTLIPLGGGKAVQLARGAFLPVAGREAAKAALAKEIGVGVVTTGGVINAASAGSQAYDDVLAKGGTQEEADRAFKIAALGAGAVSGAASRMTGLEQRVFAGQPVREGILRSAGRAAIGEAPQEFVEEGGAALATNVGKLGTAAEVPIGEDVLSSGALGAIGGGIIAAPIGGLQGAFNRGEADAGTPPPPSSSRASRPSAPPPAPPADMGALTKALGPVGGKVTLNEPSGPRDYTYQGIDEDGSVVLADEDGVIYSEDPAQVQAAIKAGVAEPESGLGGMAFGMDITEGLPDVVAPPPPPPPPPPSFSAEDGWVESVVEEAGSPNNTQQRFVRNDNDGIRNVRVKDGSVVADTLTTDYDALDLDGDPFPVRVVKNNVTGKVRLSSIETGRAVGDITALIEAGIPVEEAIRRMIDPEGPLPTKAVPKATQEDSTERDTAFRGLASAQRGEPEDAMVAAQRDTETAAATPGYNSYTNLLENVGDLTNRMANPQEIGATYGKIESALVVLKNEADAANLANIPLTPQIETYAAAHAKLPVYNEAQRLARDAAVALGRKDFETARANLTTLKEMKDNGSLEEEAAKYERSFETQAAPPPPPPPPPPPAAKEVASEQEIERLGKEWGEAEGLFNRVYRSEEQTPEDMSEKETEMFFRGHDKLWDDSQRAGANYFRATGNAKELKFFLSQIGTRTAEEQMELNYLVNEATNDNIPGDIEGGFEIDPNDPESVARFKKALAPSSKPGRVPSRSAADFNTFSELAVVEEPELPPPPPERVRTVTTPKGTKVNTAFEVVDAKDLTAATGDLQNRDRTRASTPLQVQEIFSKFDPERLGESFESDRGSPIIGPGNVIESGNGRVMAINKVYDESPEKADAYRQFIEGQGFDTFGFERPVLVRRRIDRMTPDQRSAFTRESNLPTKLQLSTSEKALNDAASLTPDVMGLMASPDVSASANQGFVRAFLSKLPAQEQAAFLDKDGRLSADGIRRLRTAVKSSAYGDADLINTLDESQDNNIKSVGGALEDVAAAWRRMLDAIRDGEVDAEMDTTEQLVEAAKIVRDVRNKGTKIADFLAQNDAFNPLDPVTERFIRSFYNETLGRAAGREAIADVLEKYARRASEQTTSDGLFERASLPPAAILDGILDERGRDKADLFNNGKGVKDNEQALDVLINGTPDQMRNAVAKAQEPNDKSNEEAAKLQSKNRGCD